MQMDHIEEFISFARCLNITKAADMRFISKSAFSKHMRQLEHDLGYTLIERHGGKFHLTQEGEIFCNSFVRMLDEYNEACRQCEEIEMQHRDPFFVQDPSYQDDTALAVYSLVSQMKAKYPYLPIRYRHPQRRGIMEILQSGKIHVAILHTSSPVADLIAEADLFLVKKLADDCLAVWCKRDSQLAKKGNISLEDMRSVKVLTANDIYSPLRSIYCGYCDERHCEANFHYIDSESPSTLLTSDYPGTVFLIPKSSSGDYRIKGRNDMCICSLENDELSFSSYAIMLREAILDCPELESVFDAVNCEPR